MVKGLCHRYLPTADMPSVCRLSLDRALLPLLGRLKPGVVLDVGAKDSPYRRHLVAGRYMTLDLDPGSQPDICADLCAIPWESDYFDLVLATEVLEHLAEPARAVAEMGRILKPGGACVLTTRFMYMYHPDPADYYRFTADSLAYLFRDFAEAEVIPHGNGFQLIWHILNNEYRHSRFLLNVFNGLVSRVRVERTCFPLGFVVMARK